MNTILIGYFAKSRKLRPTDLTVSAEVSEIASVSGCIAQQPEDWINHWKHNDWFVFDSPDTALSIAQKEPHVLLYAYSVLPVVFTPAGEKNIQIAGVAPVPLGQDFALLGYDVASRSITPEFECSPLSCNELGREVWVNRFCLLNSLDEAIAFAKRCAKEQPEPGDYFVIEVRAAQPEALSNST